MNKLSVKNVMNSHVIWVEEHASIDEAIDRLLRFGISGLPVLNDDHQLVGVLTEYDLLKLIYDPSPEKESVLSYASADVQTVQDTDSLTEVVDLFLDSSIRRLPVVNQNNQLVGIISRRDVIQFIRQLRLKTSELIHKRQQASEYLECN